MLMLSPDSFDTTATNFPFPSPTAPAPGPSLLDDNESKFLDSFFDGVSNDHFSYDLFTNPPDGSELGLGWDELPPTFMGTTSSFGQQPVIGSHGIPEPNFGGMNSQMNAGPSIPPSTSADVLAAATLLQNGSVGRSHSMGDGTLFGAQDMSIAANGNMRSHSVSQYAPSRPTHGLPQRATGESFFRHNYYRDMVFGNDSDAAMRRRLASQKVDIQWGSDAGFGSPQGFINTDQEKIAASERSHLQVVDSAFTIDTSNITSSAENTQPSSPVHQRTKSANHNAEDDQDSRPRKRRKSKFPDEEEEETKHSASTTSKQSGKKRKSVKKAQDESPGADSEQGQRRRKSATASAAAAAKASRENLTEDQKRENHIKSEQKRRTLIREGFEDLGELVPGLKGGGFSKSAVLIMAADWLEELIQGNQELQGRLNQMEGR
jgi:hypothetical protein